MTKATLLKWPVSADQLAALFEKLTGRKPTAEEIEAARRTLAKTLHVLALTIVFASNAVAQPCPLTANACIDVPAPPMPYRSGPIFSFPPRAYPASAYKPAAWSGRPIYPPGAAAVLGSPPIGSYAPPPGYLAPPTPGPGSIPPPRTYARPGPLPPGPPSQEAWRQRLLNEGREFCRVYPDDPVCGGR